MPTTYKELSEQRTGLVKKLEDLAKITEDRAWTVEEKAENVKIWADVEKLDEERKAAWDYETNRRKVAALAAESDGFGDDEGGDDGHEERSDRRSSRDGRRPNAEEQSEAMRAWALSGESTNVAIRSEDLDRAKRMGFDPARGNIVLRRAHQPPEKLRDAYNRSRERRALGVGTSTLGGSMVPTTTMDEIDIALLQYGGMLQASRRVVTDSGEAMVWPTVNDTSAAGRIAAEHDVIPDRNTTTGSVSINAYVLHSDIVRVSIQLLQDSAIDVAELLGKLLGTSIGRGVNNYLTTGTGTAQPRGILATSGGAADSGVALATASTFTWAELMSFKHSVDPAYRVGPRTAWMMHDATQAKIRAMTGTVGQTFWLDNPRDGGMPLLDGNPVFINQSMAQPGDDTKIALYGDFDHYIVREVQNVTFRRFDEKYAEYGQVGFMAWYRFDGALLNAGTNPIKYMKDKNV